ncbi:MAG TPA: 2-C-methyl-D-erythritol 4-phosphate cytidylyltransferase [Burkholderiales bacterium]|jgi:2-C-methyl-D-erythritol 4-phosphate cytidylyltransferase
MSRHFALVPAAGLGARFGGNTPKQYLPVHGRPLLWHAVAVLARHPRIERVFVVLHPKDEHFARQPWGGLGKIEGLRVGGDTRADSVRNGLRAMANAADEDWVLVHDAVRPCLTTPMLDRLLSEVGEDDAGGLLAVPLADTLKRADAQARVLATEPREGRWRAQTPQMFRHGVLLAALSAAREATDEASAVEAMGFKPKLVMGSDLNLKVTWPDDLLLAEMVLRAVQPASSPPANDV